MFNEDITTASSSLDPQRAAEAFERLRPRIEALPEAALSTGGTDRRKAAIGAAAMGRMVCLPQVRSRFAVLPEEEFSQSHVDDLEAAALACWHALVELDAAVVQSREAKLPVPLVDEATAVKARMLKLVTYHLEDHPEAGPEIAAIRVGTGYIDLAADLTRLAKLYATHRDVVTNDTKHYAPSDATAAVRLADTIVRELGEARNLSEQKWSDLARRAFALLVQIHDEVTSAGRWLFRHENGIERFSSIYVLGRNNRSRSTPEATVPEPTAPTAPQVIAPEAPAQPLSAPASTAPISAPAAP